MFRNFLALQLWQYFKSQVYINVFDIIISIVSSFKQSVVFQVFSYLCSVDTRQNKREASELNEYLLYVFFHRLNYKTDKRRSMTVHLHIINGIRGIKHFGTFYHWKIINSGIISETLHLDYFPIKAYSVVSTWTGLKKRYYRVLCIGVIKHGENAEHGLKE